MKALGLKATTEEVRKMIEDVDADNSGTIDFSEFLVMMERQMVRFAFMRLSFLAQKEESGG